jgi:hypothetical protein
MFRAHGRFLNDFESNPYCAEEDHLPPLVHVTLSRATWSNLLTTVERKCMSSKFRTDPVFATVQDNLVQSHSWQPRDRFAPH